MNDGVSTPTSAVFALRILVEVSSANARFEYEDSDFARLISDSSDSRR